MNLTAYSDSESDDGDASPAPQPATKAASKAAPKPAFQKVVDRSTPGRIKVTLPGAVQPQVHKDDIKDGAPPAKKPRLGGGSAFGGFNAMLPAPKKPHVATATATAGAAIGKRGVGLKTGPEPAFRRESKVGADDDDENSNPAKREPMHKEDFRAMLHLPPPKPEAKPAAKLQAEVDTLSSGPQHVPKPAAPRFVPMSVGRGMKKKPSARPPASIAADGAKASSVPSGALQPLVTESKPARKANVSLFGLTNEVGASVTNVPDGQYQPLLYVAEEDDHSGPNQEFKAQSPHQAPPDASAPPDRLNPHDLTNIASELRLSEAERRQLFGKKGRAGPDVSAAKVVEFNTDTEYAHNEKLRQQGEQVQHNALKSISGTGKNSLRSLVSQATSQKDALEDHFASGHRNKREAGNRYGW